MKRKIRFTLCNSKVAILEITEEDFEINDKKNTLNVLFNPLINFSGNASFSGNNWYVVINHDNIEEYTVYIEPNIIWDPIKKVNYFAPGINVSTMNKIYNFIRTDIEKNRCLTKMK